MTSLGPSIPTRFGSTIFEKTLVWVRARMKVWAGMGGWVETVGMSTMVWAQVTGAGVAGMQVRVAGKRVLISELVWGEGGL